MLRIAAGSVSPITGEVATRDLLTSVPCGSRWETDCESCSRTYRKRQHLAIASGLPQPGDRQARVLLLTLTAPSFGRVHRAAWKPGVKKPDNPRRCACGRFHNPEARSHRAVIGAPLDPSRYDYAGCVAWNRSSGRLWKALRERMRRALPQYDLAFTRIQEPQHRGATHFHAVLVVRPGDGPLPTDDALMAAIADLLPAPDDEHDARLGSSTTDPHSGREVTFGSVWDLRVVTPSRDPATGQQHWGGVARYLAKYLTKATGGEDLTDKVPPGSPRAEHLARLRRFALADAAARIASRKRPAEVPMRPAGPAPTLSTRSWAAVFLDGWSFDADPVDVLAVLRELSESDKTWFAYARALLAAHPELEVRAMVADGAEVAKVADFLNCRPGDLTRAVRGLGYTGHPRTSSRGYGLTMKQLKEDARRWRRKLLGLPETPEPLPGCWELDLVATRRLRAEARGHLDHGPPALPMAV